MDPCHDAAGLGVTFPPRALSPWPREYQPSSSAAAAAAAPKTSLSSGPTTTTTWSTPKPIKHARGKHAHVELMPQPSDDADDPLNWPRYKKDVTLAALLFVVAPAAALKTALLPSSSSAAALTAVPLLLAGPVGLLACALSRLVGRRPLYLAATALLLAGTAWSATIPAGRSSSIIGARVLQGLGWGVFDTLVNMTIQDVYFEHQRNLVVTIYNLVNLVGTWGFPLVGGALSTTHSPTYQFRVLAGLLAVGVPLIWLAAPETASHDRYRCPTPSTPTLHAVRPPSSHLFPSSRIRSPSPTRPLTPVSGFTLSSPRPPSKPWRLRHRLTYPRVRAYLERQLPPVSPAHRRHFRHPFTAAIVPLLRALVAPTTLLVFLVGAVPASALWGLAALLAPLLAPAPVAASPTALGAIVAVGPCLLSTTVLVALPFLLCRRTTLLLVDSRQFTRLAHGLAVGAGSSLALVGILSFGFGLCNFMSPAAPSTSPFTPDAATRLSLPLLSLQLGVLAAATAAIDVSAAGGRPALARSASFTCPSMDRALACVADMHAAVVLLRTVAAGAFVLLVPAVVVVDNPSPSPSNRLAVVVIVLAAVHVVVAVVVVLLRCCRDEAVWRADGRVMGLVHLGGGDGFKTSTSFFETD